VMMGAHSEVLIGASVQVSSSADDPFVVDA
jgi:hypothetical protein